MPASLCELTSLTRLTGCWHTQEIKLSQAQLTYKFPQDPAATPVFPDGDGNSFRNWHRDLNNFGTDRHLHVISYYTQLISSRYTHLRVSRLRALLDGRSALPVSTHGCCILLSSGCVACMLRSFVRAGPHEVLRGKSVSLRVGIALTDMTTLNSGVTMLGRFA